MAMLSRIEIGGTEQTPHVILDKEESIFKMEGFSFPDTPFVFYADLIDWFKEYCQAPNEETHFVFAFLYVNSTSVKFIHDMLKRMDALIAEGRKARVTWMINPDDEDIEQLGQELKGLHKIPFQIVSQEPEKPQAGPKKFF